MKKGSHKIINLILISTLTVLLAVSASFLIVNDVASAYEGNGLILEYTFNIDENTTVFDSSSQMNDGNGYGLKYSLGKTGSALSFDGNGSYVKMPTGIANHEALTISAWVYLNGDDNYYSYLCAFGDNTGSNYFYIVPDTNGVCAVVFHTPDKEEKFWTLKRVEKNVWTHIAFTYENGSGRLYLDGELKGWLDGITIGPKVFGNTQNNFIGKIQFDDLGGARWLDGKIDDFKIYAKALTVSEIQADMVTSDEQAVKSDAESIRLKVDDDGYIKENFSLPTVGAHETLISWESSDKTAIDNLGNVIFSDEIKNVTLTATVSKNSVSETKEFKVKVDKKTKGNYLKQTTLTDGILAEVYNLNVERLLSYEYDPDRLLLPIRTTANIESSANPLGGWESADCGIRGYTLGYWLSSMAKIYYSTGNVEAKERANYVVDELYKIQQINGGKYVGGVPLENFTLLEEGSDKPWVPYYMLGKILAGCIDMYSLTGNETALTVAKNLGLWVYERNVGLDSVKHKNVIKKEYGNVSYSMYDLYVITGDERYFEGALLFEETDTLITGLANNVNIIHNLHTTTMLPKILAAITRYEIDGSELYLKAAENFFDMVNKTAYSTGGFATFELFKNEDETADFIASDTNQTCDVYYFMKIAYRLWTITHDVKYFNYYEKALFNHGIACQNPETGAKNYFQSMSTGREQEWLAKETCICCDATGAELITEMHDSIYYAEGNDLYVNLYANSEYVWHEKNITISQKSSFPNMSSSMFAFKVTDEGGCSFRLLLRKSDWMNNCVIKVNGVAVNAVEKDGYFEIERVWTNGDEISFSRSLSLTLSCSKGKTNQYSVSYGPIVLAAEVDDSDDLNQFITILASENSDLSTVLNKFSLIDSGKVSFVYEDGLRMLSFRPYCEFSKGSHITYFRITDESSELFESVRQNMSVKVSASYVAPGETCHGLNDMKIIIGSQYRTGAIYASYYAPQKENWVEYSYDTEKTFYSASVYWHKDAFGVTAPELWKIQVYNEEQDEFIDVKPLFEGETIDYSLEYGEYNSVLFMPTSSKRIRLYFENVEGGNGTGIIQWIVGAYEANGSSDKTKDVLKNYVEYAEKIAEESSGYTEATVLKLKRIVGEVKKILEDNESAKFESSLKRLSDAVNELEKNIYYRFEVENHIGKISASVADSVKTGNEGNEGFLVFTSGETTGAEGGYAPYGMEITNVKAGHYFVRLRIKGMSISHPGETLKIDAYNFSNDEVVEIANIDGNDITINQWTTLSYRIVIPKSYDKLEFRVYYYQCNDFVLDYLSFESDKQEEKCMLENAIYEADRLDLSNYTESSAQSLLTVLNYAYKVADNPDLESEIYSSAANAVTSAINGLEPKQNNVENDKINTNKDGKLKPWQIALTCIGCIAFAAAGVSILIIAKKKRIKNN